METKYLKKYAPEARRDFIEAVTNRAAVFGLLPKEILPMQEEGDVVIIGDRPFPRSVAKQRNELEARIKAKGFEHFIEAIAYTWFNRFVAIRYMELHGYLSHGYRVLSHPSDGAAPEVMEYAERLDLPGLDTDKVIDLKLDGSKDDELYRMVLVAQCNALHKIMPFMFERVDDASELLLPDNLLHTGSVVRRLVDGLPPASLEDIEAVGWLYQFYISEKKDDVFAALKKGKKITPENIPAATQLFTPHWIVCYLVENSLGRLWMLNHPDSRLIEQMDYYIKPEEPEEDFLQISSPEEIKICDPACGSGHMLTYAFDLLYAIYEEQGYQATDIPRLILTHNLYGIEIDQRAGALAAFALTMKAREKYRRFLTGGPDSQNRGVQPNICVLENISIDPEDLSAYMDKVGRDLFSGGLQGVVNQWEEADNFGSLIRPLVTDVSEVLELLRDSSVGEDLFLAGVHQKVLAALRQADYLSPKYHVVVANPPYMGGKGMNDVMKKFAKKKYKDDKSDLFAMFISRAREMCAADGYVAMITMQSWMFLSSFKAFRSTLLEEAAFLSMLHLGERAFDSIGGAVVSTTAFTLKTAPNELLAGSFIRLTDGDSEAEKQELFQERKDTPFQVVPEQFRALPGMPIVYWISTQVREVFKSSPPLSDYGIARIGLQTGDNERFVREWQEVSLSRIGFAATDRDDAATMNRKWFPYNKGGGYRKWAGNQQFLVNWEHDGKEIIEYQEYLNSIKPASSKMGIANNSEYYFRKSISWSKVSTSTLAFRHFPSGFVFDVAGTSYFPTSDSDHSLLLALLNSRIVEVFIGSVNPTLNFEAGKLVETPILVPSGTDREYCEENASHLATLHQQDWDSFETAWDFECSPLLSERDGCLSKAYQQFQSTCSQRVAEVQQLESANNQIFLRCYGLSDELTADVSQKDVTLLANPAYRYDEDKDVSELEALLLADTMREFISYAVGCMLGRYSLDKPGLILANGGETADDYRQQIPEPTFAPDEDNVIPLLDGDWFTDDISERFKEFLKVTFGSEHYEENLTFLENALYPDNETARTRKTILDYFTKDFFKHHLKLYKKRPIYWLFSSGKQGGFRALIYMHRYNSGTLSRIRTAYVVPLQGKYNSRIDQLESDIPATTSTSNRKKLEKERDKLIKQREELHTFDEKLRHYADQRIELDLDDGVKENYGKFGDLLAEVKAVTGKKAKG